MKIPCALTVVLFAFGLFEGCGGNGSSGAAGTGGASVTTSTGSSTTSGAGGSGLGPRPSGSLSLYLTTATTPATARCPPVSHWVNIPFSAMGQTTTATTRGEVAVDGAGEATVSCSVKSLGGRFEISGSLKSPSFDAMGNPRNPTVVALRTSIAANEAGANGTVSIVDDKTVTTFSSDSCSFSVQRQPPNLLDVAPGRVWASVTCPAFRDPLSADVDAVCQIATGFFTLENCDR